MNNPQQTIQSFLDQIREHDGVMLTEGQRIVNHRAIEFVCQALPRAGEALAKAVEVLNFIKTPHKTSSGLNYPDHVEASKALKEIAAILSGGSGEK